MQQETVLKRLANNSHHLSNGQITHKNLDMIESAMKNRPKKFTKVKSSYIGMQKIMKKHFLERNRGYSLS